MNCYSWFHSAFFGGSAITSSLCLSTSELGAAALVSALDSESWPEALWINRTNPYDLHFMFLNFKRSESQWLCANDLDHDVIEGC